MIESASRERTEKRRTSAFFLGALFIFNEGAHPRGLIRVRPSVKVVPLNSQSGKRSFEVPRKLAKKLFYFLECWFVFTGIRGRRSVSAANVTVNLMGRGFLRNRRPLGRQ